MDGWNATTSSLQAERGRGLEFIEEEYTELIRFLAESTKSQDQAQSVWAQGQGADRQQILRADEQLQDDFCNFAMGNFWGTHRVKISESSW